MIELYVFGLAGADELKQVEDMAARYPVVRTAIDRLEMALEKQAMENAIAPPPTIKPDLMATLDYMSRMEKGEAPEFPPALRHGSQITDYARWLDRPDMVLPPFFEDTYAKIIGNEPGLMTAIVWLKYGAPGEVHEKVYEKFLVVEGTCDIFIEEEVHHLAAGDFLAIPLFKNHHVSVTSDIPCKVILQRMAA